MACLGAHRLSEVLDADDAFYRHHAAQAESCDYGSGRATVRLESPFLRDDTVVFLGSSTGERRPDTSMLRGDFAASSSSSSAVAHQHAAAESIERAAMQEDPDVMVVPAKVATLASSLVSSSSSATTTAAAESKKTKEKNSNEQCSRASDEVPLAVEGGKTVAYYQVAAIVGHRIAENGHEQVRVRWASTWEDRKAMEAAVPEKVRKLVKRLRELETRVRTPPVKRARKSK